MRDTIATPGIGSDPKGNTMNITNEMVNSALRAADFIPNGLNREWMRSALEAALAAAPASAAAERREEEIQRLEEIADGAWGDDPRTRGSARDRLKELKVE